jgi:putative PIN family toxin of toxin-antitoxin system
MMQIVLDTNVYISGFLFGGKPFEILNHIEDERVGLCYSAPIRQEVEAVLAEKFRWPREWIDLACGPFWNIGRRVKPSRTIHACSDPDDDRILECAVQAQAQFIITGDKHLLNMMRFEQVTILRPDEFLKLAKL